jgi:dienelactone hydrolase
MIKMGKWFYVVLVAGLSALPVVASAAIIEEVIEMPIELKNRFGLEAKQVMKIGVLRDDAKSAPQPFLILGHGRPANGNFAGTSWTSYRTQARYFASRGFAVFVPVRVGYGETGGMDVEESGPCNSLDYEFTYRVGGAQTRKVIELAQKLSYVNPARGIVAGQSFGGTLAIEAAAGNIAGVVATINFAGGGGGDPVGRPANPCRADLLEDLFVRYGKTSKIPTLWLYSENDAYWGKKIPHNWFAAFVKNGAKAEFIQLAPVENAQPSAGHLAFSRSMKEWRPHVERFLASVGFE